METASLKKFAQGARRQLLQQVAARLEQVLRSDSVEIREKAKVVVELKAQIEQHSKKSVIDRVAYTWFNRFCALRFMDVNHYTRIGAVSPQEGFTQPEILQEAKQGHIDEELQSHLNKQTIFDLLNGKRPSSDPQQEAYRLLLVGICNSFNEIMPFMFEKIEDYTELLMPLDLLSENSVLHDLREALTPEVCEDVEVIGWLYQYYISERKDEVFEALKQNKKIEAQDIPAATQLFTPHWIVRYLVENSLGRLWMLNHPDSRLIKKMEYYIKPEQVETDFLKIASPEELKICDPACGSGHMLTYAFDLLFAIYEEEGYPVAEIPRLILEKNLFGVEIDPRAGALSAFSVFMKARSKDRRFFNRGAEPNICVLENVTFTDAELKQYTNAVGNDLFTELLKETLRQFEQADNFGSLIRPLLTDVGYVRGLLEGKNLGGDLFLFGVHERVLKVLNYAEFLTPRYHVVVANPPYMGNRNMGAELRNFIRDKYENVKADYFSCFIIRNIELTLEKGQLGFMSPFVWMFLSSYEDLRDIIIDTRTITSLIQLEYSGFDGATVPICTFTIENFRRPKFRGGYIKLSEFKGHLNQSPKTLEAIKNPDCGWFYRTSADKFKKIPGSPIAYWITNKVRAIFEKSKSFGDFAVPAVGLNTGDNDRFLRSWSEVQISDIKFGCKTIEQAKYTEQRWFPYNKGGEFRKWYGNQSLVINWKDDGKEVKEYAVIRNAGKHWSRYIQNLDYMFKEGVTWSATSSAYFGCRYTDSGFLFDVKGTSAFSNEIHPYLMVGFLTTKLVDRMLKFLNPTIEFQTRDIRNLPFKEEIVNNPDLHAICRKCISISKKDWDSYEISWNFTAHPIIGLYDKAVQMSNTYDALRSLWQKMTYDMKLLEIENNRIFIDSYSLQDELSPDLSLQDITLTCNPYFRYSNKKSEDELEVLLRTDTMREFISYAVGCMFGRYSLDKPGLILANQGETMKDYFKQVHKPTFMPDEDNVIPVLEGEWFNDDISERFKKFLRVTFGDEHYEENLAFIEDSIGRDIRSYFTKEFYKDHVQTYKKRPIYWMFSSPKGSFNVMIYMHRYKPDTVSIVLDGYLREYVKKLASHKSHLEAISVGANSSQSQKTKALREITQVNTILAELKEYERVIYELASQQIKIDLDDGVKVNYNKFGTALKSVPGLSE